MSRVLSVILDPAVNYEGTFSANYTRQSFSMIPRGAEHHLEQRSKPGSR